MFFEIDRDSFNEGLAKAVPITEKKSSLPILSHVLVDASDAGLLLTATDLTVGLRINLLCDVKEPGVLAIPGKKLHEIIRELSPGLVGVTLTESNRVKISSGKSEFQLVSMDASDYPAWSSVDDVQTTPIEADTLVNMIDKTLFAASSDESRFNLNGVLFEEQEDKIKLVATDGHRLATIDEALAMSIPSKRVVIPKKSLLELKRMLESVKEEVLLGFEEKNLVVKTPRFIMTARLTEGEYPDYRKVIPVGGERVLTVNRLQLLHTLRRVAVFTSDRNKGITISVSPGSMEITATHPDLGTARDVVDVQYEGEEFSLIVNVAYLMESLQSVDSEVLSMDFHKEAEPIIVSPEPPKNYFNLVMPMRK